MNERKHTPGPWDKVLSGGYVIKGGELFPELSFEVKEKGESWIDLWKRTKPEREEKYEEVRANQRLQKMAPEMFDELQDIVDMANMNPNGAANVFLSAADMQSIQRVLNKAKGKINEY